MMKNFKEMKRNEMIKELKEMNISFDLKMKNEELIELLEDSSKNENSENSSDNQEISQNSENSSNENENSDNSEKINFLEYLNDSKIKESNYEEIHNKFMNHSEISMIDSLNILNIRNQNIREFISNDENKKNFNDEFEFIMIHRESRKIYYLFLYDKKNNQEIFIMKNDSIMKNKIYLLKFSQFFEIDSLKIHYIKNDRKNQSKEIIDRNSKDYQEKIKKYSMI